MTAWNDRAYTEIIEQHPELEAKSEATAFCTWVMKQNPEVELEKLRAKASKAGLTVAGRAIGSARQVLRMAPKMSAKKSSPTKRKRGRPRKSASPNQNLSGLTDVVQAMGKMQRDHKQAMEALAKIRDVCVSVVGR